MYKRKTNLKMMNYPSDDQAEIEGLEIIRRIKDALELIAKELHNIATSLKGDKND